MEIIQGVLMGLSITITSVICTQCNQASSHYVKESATISPIEKSKDSLAFGDVNWVGDGLIGKVYLLAENTEKLPKFDTMNSVATLYTRTIDVSPRSWDAGFPGVPDRFEWFGIEYKGNFRVKKAGHYSFRLLSDDGAKVYIDDSLVIDNDGQHPPSSASGEIDLDGSNHSVIIQYFQGPRYQIALQLFASFDKEAEQIFPGNNFVLSTPSGNHTLWIVISISLILLILLFLYYWLWRKRKISVEL